MTDKIDHASPHGGLHGYYQQQGVLPTFAAFRDEAALAEYARKRALLMDKLHLPVGLFNGAELLEFGPDSGENALVFGQWGARMTLVEPNPNAWPKIASYFERFGLQDRLRSLEKVSIQDYAPPRDGMFDLVVAEGFIYTVRPEQLWINLFRRVLKPGGLALISYQERSGSLFEFLMKVVQAQHRRLTGLSPVESAARIFTAKWDSVPHTRRFESWVMDVLENPYVRRAFAFDADELYQQTAAAGLPVHGSWPRYADALSVYWHKQEIPADQRVAMDRQHIARSRVSFVLGSKAYLTGTTAEVERTAAQVQVAIEAIDGLVDRFDQGAADRAIGALASLRDTLEQGGAIIDLVPHRPAPVAALRSAEGALRVCGSGDAAAIARFCQTDAGFIGAWGQPAHLVTLRREG